MNVNWVNDDAAVSVLSDIGIEVVDREISVSEINKKASRENRARRECLDSSRIEGIYHSMQKGVPIPKIVVRKTNTGLVIAGGNHRFASINGSQTIHAHVIECTDDEFELACGLLNTVVGAGLTREERIEKAVHAVTALKMTYHAAASQFGVSETSVRDAVRMSDFYRSFDQLSSRARSKVTLTHVKALGDLQKNINVSRAAVNAICNASLTAKDVSELAKVARLKPTESEQVQVFINAIEQSQKEKKKVVPRKVKRHFSALCTQIQNLKGKQTWASLQFQPSEIEEQKKVIADVINILSCLLRADG